MRDAQLELVCDGCHPGVILSLKHLLWACQVQVTYRQRETKLHIYRKEKKRGMGQNKK